MKSVIQLAAIAAAITLCGCRAKDAATTDSTKVSQAGAAVGTAASRGTFDPAARVLTVYAKEFAYEMPDTITAGWTTVHLVNDGMQLHHVQLVRLDSGKTTNDLLAALKNPGPPPAWVAMVGGPNAPNPKGEVSATMNLAPGNYAVLCFVDLGDHVPHFAKGMAHPLTVTANGGDMGKEPVADMNVALNDYSFAIDGAVKAGKHVVKVANKGPQEHEIEIVRLADGKTLKDFQTWLATMDGPPPASAVGGIAGMAPGTSSYVALDLAPGTYALVCFIPDAKDGKAHLAHGMVKEIKVT